MDLQCLAIEFQKGLPSQLGGDNRFFLIRWLGQFVRHFQEEQKGDLLCISHVRKPIVPQNVGKIPGFVDDLLGGVCAHLVLLSFCRILYFVGIWPYFDGKSEQILSTFEDSAFVPFGFVHDKAIKIDRTVLENRFLLLRKRTI